MRMVLGAGGMRRNKKFDKHEQKKIVHSRGGLSTYLTVSSDGYNYTPWEYWVLSAGPGAKDKPSFVYLQLFKHKTSKQL